MFRRADLCLMHRVLYGGAVHDHDQNAHHLPPVGQRLIDRRPLGAVQHGAREIEMPCDLPPGQGLFKVVRNLLQQVRWGDLRQVFAHDLIRWPAEGRTVGVIDESIGHIGREKGRLHRQMVEEVGQPAPCLIGIGGVLQLAPVAHHAPDLRHQHRKRRHRKDQFDRIAIGAAAQGRCQDDGDIKRQDRNRAPTAKRLIASPICLAIITPDKTIPHSAINVNAATKLMRTSTFPQRSAFSAPLSIGGNPDKGRLNRLVKRVYDGAP